VPLSEKELNELDDFLLSDAVPENTMNISMLDGFLTALAIGPNTVMPSKWMPEIWGGDEMIWDSMEQLQHILTLIHRLQNTIISGFEQKSIDFQPIFFESKDSLIYDDWCVGFMQAFLLSRDEWEPIKELESFFPILLYGTQEGWKFLEKKPLSDVPHADWEGLIHRSVIEIHDFWLPHRRAVHAALKQAIRPKVGRNDPCPCGSGKKFKNCCMD
ncbi:MAG: UPF0149 family protein, partial [Candidatus Marinimicrobia bacterium]|nr:UPF0149 family protein [Candidatus Neomarinimicrobiota bacterium]